jgi:hypothetical protein
MGCRKPLAVLNVLPEPCNTCPYRKDTPPGIWHQEEYKKLPRFDDDSVIAIFMCHNAGPKDNNNTVCRGWLSVHADSISVRLEILRGRITPKQAYAKIKTSLYATGKQACAAGLKGYKRPSKRAIAAAQKIVNTRRKRGRK